MGILRTRAWPAPTAHFATIRRKITIAGRAANTNDGHYDTRLYRLTASTLCISIEYQDTWRRVLAYLVSVYIDCGRDYGALHSGEADCLILHAPPIPGADSQ